MVTVLIIRRVCYSECGMRVVAEDMCCARTTCCDRLHISLRDVLRQIQDPVSVTIFLCHIWAESLGCHCKAFPVLVSTSKSRKYIYLVCPGVVRKANSMQHGHRCACICGS